MTQTPSLPRSQATRILHLMLLLCVVHQLAGSQFIHRPIPGEPAGWLYLQHEYVGLATMPVLLGFWMWSLVRRGETSLGRLLPWFSPRRLGDLWRDLTSQLRLIARLQVPDDEDGAFASAVHGLGLLVATLMTASGTIYFFLEGSAAGRPYLSVHKLSANLMWAYLVGHAGIAVLHHLLGSDIFSRMFWNKRRQRKLA